MYVCVCIYIYISETLTTYSFLGLYMSVCIDTQSCSSIYCRG